MQSSPGISPAQKSKKCQSISRTNWLLQKVFIKNYATIAAPLTDLTKKEAAFHWSDACENAFQTLKEKCAHAPILAYPDYQKEYLLYTDVSSSAIGMVLAQIQEGKEHVICYGGKKLNQAEQTYSTTERKCFEVIVDLLGFVGRIAKKF